MLFRIEHPFDEIGPYRFRNNLSSMFKNQMQIDAFEKWRSKMLRHGTLKRTPQPSGFVITYNKHIFAFLTEGHLNKWFTREERRFLRAAGFVVSTIEIPEIYWHDPESGQAVIDKDRILHKTQQKILTR